MRILHCADLHLDSKMTAHLSPEKAKERRQEILGTFRRMVDFAAENRVEAVLIAGDLFDRNTCSAAARNTCISLIRDHREIRFFYLQGNHDAGQIFAGQENNLPNLYQFSTEHWSSFEIGGSGICITGAELTEAGQLRLLSEFSLDREKYNIVILHGQAEDSNLGESGSMSGTAPVIPLRFLAGKGIDYLALGHIHKRDAGRLDGRGIWCYPGCLEGRGFDECGDHGCILLDVDPVSHKTLLSFVPLAGRKFYELPLDISGCRDSQEILEAVRGMLKEQPVTSRDFLRILLEGETELTGEIPEDWLSRQLTHLFYYVRTENRTRLKVDYRSFASDPSLKGEFVRHVRQDSSLSEEEKAEVVRLGIRLLMGVEEFEDS